MFSLGDLLFSSTQSIFGFMEPLPNIINSCGLFLSIEPSFFAIPEFSFKLRGTILRKAQIS
jgi:hypothetical protein